MAKRTIKPKDGNPFAGTGEDKRPAPLKPYACRKLRGPGTHEGYDVFMAHDEADAKRQWFCHHGLALRTHAYDLQCQELDRNHPACKDAKIVTAPVDEGGSVEAMMKRDFIDVQQDIARKTVAAT